jgi:hypothetical protein
LQLPHCAEIMTKPRGLDHRGGTLNFRHLVIGARFSGLPTR